MSGGRVTMATVQTDGDGTLDDVRVEYDGNDTWLAPDGRVFNDEDILGFWTASQWIATVRHLDGTAGHYLIYARNYQDACEAAGDDPRVAEVEKVLRGYPVSPPNDSAIDTAERGEGS